MLVAGGGLLAAATMTQWSVTSKMVKPAGYFSQFANSTIFNLFFYFLFNSFTFCLQVAGLRKVGEGFIEQPVMGLGLQVRTIIWWLVANILSS